MTSHIFVLNRSVAVMCTVAIVCTKVGIVFQ